MPSLYSDSFFASRLLNSGAMSLSSSGSDFSSASVVKYSLGLRNFLMSLDEATATVVKLPLS
jgi:hypothetical protein